MNRVFKTALINASFTALYIVAVGTFMYYGSLIKIGRASAFLAPIAMLLLFVSSAAITGYLIFGKPAILYVDGRKKEAIQLITYTLTCLFFFTLIVLGVLVSFGH